MTSPPPQTGESPTPGYPTLADVDRIVAQNDPALRNLQITHAYSELSRALVRHHGRRANWCTYATWASKQAGQAIRGEDLERAVERRFGAASELARGTGQVVDLLLRIRPRQDPLGLRTAVHEALNPASAIRRASKAVAEGNRKVFDEVGRGFATFRDLVAHRDATVPQRLSAFFDGFSPGESPEGQDMLRDAFLHTHEALVADDEKVRHEKLHLANLEVGFHEQIRLEPEIAAALNAPLVDPHELAEGLIATALPDAAGRVAELVGQVLATVKGPLYEACEALVDAAQAVVRKLVTGILMELRLPDQRLDLDRDLTKPYPDTLRRIQDPELIAMIRRVDPNPDTLRGTGARDWASFADRMHCIGEYFRAYQDHAPLFEPPFDAAQVRELTQGRRPRGRL